MDNWDQRKRPVRLERRLDFETYEATRSFLDRRGDLSESKKIFPDISFGKNFVNLSLICLGP